MKVIFLDHDGVICLSSEWGGRLSKQVKFRKKLTASIQSFPIDIRFDKFNKKAVKVLNEILEKTDVEIVVSSDWKTFANLKEMGDFYISQGVIKKPIAFTPSLTLCTWQDDEKDFSWDKNFDLELNRVIEIRQFLIDHPEITHWVAVDDLNLGKEFTKYNGEIIKNKFGLENFVNTPKSDEGIKQTGIKEKIINFLMDPKN